MESVFPFRDIEKKWQSIWKELQIDKSELNTNKEKMYVLEMLPYPSGKIHMGHVRNYTIGDVIARYFKLQGKNVFHPIGWDAFGLPAENAAIDKGVNPQEWTYKNIEDMKIQLQAFGLSYDWDTELATCSPEYYQWNQWLFRELYKKGLAYKKHAKVNFCPSCKTVLANEQVTNGRCWRCNSLVEMKPLSQWYLGITQYAEPLLEQQKLLKGHWPDRVLHMQEHWIGKSQGAEIYFPVRGYNKTIEVFTTTPETIFGATFLTLAPEHSFVTELLEKGTYPELEDFLKHIQSQTEQERTNPKTPKKGFFTGFFALNPITQEPLPIYVANFVLIEYGKGAVMGVPGHDSRDLDFAKTYNLPIKIVVNNPEYSFKEGEIVPPCGTLVDSAEFSGLTLEEGFSQITKTLEKKGLGRLITQYRLRDWLISRQRYWGTPIPIIYCPNCGPVLVPEKDLPVVLPTDIEFKVGENPLLSSPTFLHTPCPECGKMAQRETDTMDTFFDSSWYFMRYTNPNNNKEILNKQKSLYWLPVDYYVGGIEHAVLHLLYARFFYYIFEELGFVDGKEPFKNLITQGMVLSHSYYCTECKTYYPEEAIKNKRCPQQHDSIHIKMDKMSKSKNNGIDPEGLLKEYGADASRLFTLFTAPIDRDLEWNGHSVMGCLRFIKRFYTYCEKYSSILKQSVGEIDYYSLTVDEKNLLKKFHQTIKKIRQEMKDFSYNTVIASLMEFLNSLEHYEPKNSLHSLALLHSILTQFAILLFPMAPHTAEECYQLVGGKEKSIVYTTYPDFCPEWIQEQEQTYAIQINGKHKINLTLSTQVDQQEVENQAKKLHIIQKSLENQTIVKTIFVQGKIINFVVKPL